MPVKKGNNSSQYYMGEAIIESQKAKVLSSPNPHVGAILVKNNKIIGRGHTQQPGKAHAEVMAIKKAGTLARNATLYVTLEPCCFTGQTGPCTDVIIQNKIKTVYIGLKDPNTLVHGKGIKKLKKAGIKVFTGICRLEIREELQWFTKYIQKKTPYTVLKAGISLDGKISDQKGNSKWITSEKARALAQELRAENDGILVGVNTILKDNPSLTYRGRKKKGLFTRIILDTKLRLDLNSKVLKKTEGHQTIIAVGEGLKKKSKIQAIEKKGVKIILCKIRDKQIDCKDVLKQLGEQGLAKIIIEGGSSINHSFLKSGQVDKVQLYISPKILGGDNSRGWIGNHGFLLGQNKKIENGKFINILDEEFLFKGYINHYVYRNN